MHGTRFVIRPHASHIQLTGQTPRCFATNPNTTVGPWRSRRSPSSSGLNQWRSNDDFLNQWRTMARPFLGCRAPLSAWRLHAADFRPLHPRASSALCQGRHLTRSIQVHAPTGAEPSRVNPDPAQPEQCSRPALSPTEPLPSYTLGCSSSSSSLSSSFINTLSRRPRNRQQLSTKRLRHRSCASSSVSPRRPSRRWRTGSCTPIASPCGKSELLAGRSARPVRPTS